MSEKVQVSDETIKCYLLTKGVSFHQKENIVPCYKYIDLTKRDRYKEFGEALDNMRPPYKRNNPGCGELLVILWFVAIVYLITFITDFAIHFGHIWFGIMFIGLALYLYSIIFIKDDD